MWSNLFPLGVSEHGLRLHFLHCESGAFARAGEAEDLRRAGWPCSVRVTSQFEIARRFSSEISAFSDWAVQCAFGNSVSAEFGGQASDVGFVGGIELFSAFVGSGTARFIVKSPSETVSPIRGLPLGEI